MFSSAGEPRKDPRQLERAADAEPVDAVRPEIPDRPAVEAHIAGVLGDEAGDEIEHGGLSRTVGPDEAGDAARLK